MNDPFCYCALSGLELCTGSADERIAAKIRYSDDPEWLQRVAMFPGMQLSVVRAEKKRHAQLTKGK